MQKFFAVCDGSAFTVDDTETVHHTSLEPGRTAGSRDASKDSKRARFLVPEVEDSSLQADEGALPASPQHAPDLQAAELRSRAADQLRRALHAGTLPGALSESLAEAAALPSSADEPPAVARPVVVDDGEWPGEYVGEWQDNLRHGHGSLKLANGGEYVGQWEGGLPSGIGRRYFVDGSEYHGEFKEGKAHGEGTFTSTTDLQYKGQWASDALSGHGDAVWPDGSKYRGLFSDGLRHGKGHAQWPDGDKFSEYDGQFVQDTMRGEGTYRWSDGRKYTGHWLDNKMHGDGIFDWPDGRIYTGAYQNGKKHGRGTLSFSQGALANRSYTGEWKEGQRDGEFTYSCWWLGSKENSRNRENSKASDVSEASEASGVWKEDSRVKWFRRGGEPNDALDADEKDHRARLV